MTATLRSVPEKAEICIPPMKSGHVQHALLVPQLYNKTMPIISRKNQLRSDNIVRRSLSGVFEEDLR